MSNREALDSGSVFDPGSDGGLHHPGENGFRYATVAPGAHHSHQLPFVLNIYIYLLQNAQQELYDNYTCTGRVPDPTSLSF
jgi:hypothetical protein